MSDKTVTLKVKTDHTLHGVPSGGTVKIKIDRDGVPYDKNWRRRLKDSKIDGCVEIVSPPKKKEDK